jgi:hypothetical protein
MYGRIRAENDDLGATVWFSQDIRCYQMIHLMEVGTIKAVHIYIYDGDRVTAELELNLKGVKYIFGGEKMFLSGSNGGESYDAPFLGRFLFRCMQIGDVESWDMLKSNKVLVEVVDGKVVAIGSVSGNKWFNPIAEFSEMKRNRDDVLNNPRA